MWWRRATGQIARHLEHKAGQQAVVMGALNYKPGLKAEV